MAGDLFEAVDREPKPRKLVEIREIDAWSAARINAVMGGVLGVVGTGIALLVDSRRFDFTDLGYGLAGAIGGYAGGAALAFLYNVAAGIVGGIVYEVD
jgi:hypothetical protein